MWKNLLLKKNLPKFRSYFRELEVPKFERRKMPKVRIYWRNAEKERGEKEREGDQENEVQDWRVGTKFAAWKENLATEMLLWVEGAVFLDHLHRYEDSMESLSRYCWSRGGALV